MNEFYYQLLFLCAAAFGAGFIDAIVGGGGLIQTPVSLLVLRGHPVANILATVKIPSFCGTALAARQYVRQVEIHWKLAAISCTLAFFAAYGGSLLLTEVSNSFLKPVLLVVLAAVAVYTFFKKSFGQRAAREVAPAQQLRVTVLSALVIGFYDGFIGPGTGSFLILAFIAGLGYDFLHASAQAKLTNMATNLGSITLFLLKGKILWGFALPMALCNALGGALGARTAIVKGNRFIRTLFLLVVTGTLLRIAWDLFGRH